MDPHGGGSAHPFRVLQEEDTYWKGYKLNKKPSESSGEKDNTALILGLLIGITFFLFPFIVVAVRRYVFRLRSFRTMDEIRTARVEARRREAMRRAAEMSPGDNRHQDTQKRRDYVANLLKMETFGKFSIADFSETTTSPSSEASHSDDLVLRDEEEEGETAPERCAICLEQFETGDDICVSHNLNCKHIFHYECCFEWIIKNDECPICRRAFLNFERKDEPEDDNTNDESGGCNNENQELHDHVEAMPSQSTHRFDVDAIEGHNAEEP